MTKKKRGSRTFSKLITVIMILGFASGILVHRLYKQYKAEHPNLVATWVLSGEVEVLEASFYSEGGFYEGEQLQNFIDSKIDDYSQRIVHRYDDNTFVLENWGEFTDLSYPVWFKSGEDRSQLTISTSRGGSNSGESHDITIQFANQLIEVNEVYHAAWWSETDRSSARYSITFLIHLSGE